MGAGASSGCASASSVDVADIAAANAKFQALYDRLNVRMHGDGPTLMQRLGGEGPLRLVIDRFYEKLETHPFTSPIVAGYDMRKQRQRQFCFLSYVFSGGDGYQYKGRDLTEAHAHLIENRGLSDEHIDMAIQFVKDVLEDVALPRDVINDVLALLEGTRNLLMGRSQTAPRPPRRNPPAALACPAAAAGGTDVNSGGGCPVASPAAAAATASPGPPLPASASKGGAGGGGGQVKSVSRVGPRGTLESPPRQPSPAPALAQQYRR